MPILVVIAASPRASLMHAAIRATYRAPASGGSQSSTPSRLSIRGRILEAERREHHAVIILARPGASRLVLKAIAGRDCHRKARRIARRITDRAEPGDDALEVEPRIPSPADRKVQDPAGVEQEAADRRCHAGELTRGAGRAGGPRAAASRASGRSPRRAGPARRTAGTRARCRRGSRSPTSSPSPRRRS